MLARSRVFLWCLLAGCAGGPITDFPDKASGEFGGGSKPPSIPDEDENAGDGDSLPPLEAGGDNSAEFPSDNGFSNAGDAGLSGSLPDRPCGAANPGHSDAGLPESGDGGVCSGDQCPITRRELAQLAVPGGACVRSAEVDLVCDGAIQSSIGTCNESSLQESASFSLVENCVLTDPAVSSARDACLDCYLTANRCALLNCLSECLVPTSAEACNACRKNQCGAALSACTGLPAL